MIKDIVSLKNTLSLKTIECSCGCKFSTPRDFNHIFHEHEEHVGKENAKEGILIHNKTTIEDSDEIIIQCPKCGKEAHRYKFS